MSTPKLTEAQRAHLREVVDPKHPWSIAHSVWAGFALHRGHVREVKRRDGTRPYVLTDAGRAALKEGGK